MRFDWDARKRRRVIALGEAVGIGLTVVYADRAGVGEGSIRRIISARASNRRERQAYRKAVGPT